jgi:hypothetical protein
MSAVPFTATTCCQMGTETKSANAESQPAGAPKSRRARLNASRIATPEQEQVHAQEEVVGAEAVGGRGRGRRMRDRTAWGRMRSAAAITIG